MPRLVMKFGGTSVADLERIRSAARHVKREVDGGHEVAVVVSAMAGATNQLVAWCREAAALHDAREYDAVVSSGEQVTAGLLAIVAGETGTTRREAERIARSVLATVRTHVSEGEVVRVIARLPSEIAELWEARAPEEHQDGHAESGLGG